MRPEDVPDEWVEVAAQAICQNDERNGGPPWDYWPETERAGRRAKNTYRDAAREALAAVAPLIAAREREGCAALCDALSETYANGSRQSGWGTVVETCDQLAAAICTRGTS